ncbi:MAG: hypothetical protein KatS3mg025_1864 [Bacteroidia bacterium]|nr:MAG: hypothetical protein KatS3mg025_1864 [Bacteroidia bacterium]
MRWESWPHGEAFLKEWEQLLSHKRIPAAMLWVGPEGVGKTPLAWTLAQALLCPKGDLAYACGTCGDCQVVAKLEHPFFWLLPPTGGGKPLEEALPLFRQALSQDPFLSLSEWEKLLLGGRGSLSIGVEEVRHLQGFLTLASTQAVWRVVLFWHAELLTRQAANALLKIVEEPPERTLFLFLATRVEALPATLRSRCQIKKFPPLSAQVLEKLAGTSLSVAQLSLAQGSYSRLRRVMDPAQAPYIEALRAWLRALLQPAGDTDWLPLIETLAQAPQLSDLLLMGVSLIREHPHLSLPQKNLGIDTFLRVADEIEAHLNPLLLLAEATVTLRQYWQKK